MLIRGAISSITRDTRPALQHVRDALIFYCKGNAMETGIVKWFNDAKGFGFITPDSGGEDLFAHFSEIKVEGFKSIKETQRVSFDVKEGPKGKQAANIKPV
jgi:CspA family cold shock protein